MNPELIRQAQEAIANGATEEQVLQYVQANLGEEHYMTLREHFALMSTSARGAREAQAGQRIPGAVGDFIMSAIPGLSSFADELLGPEAGRRVQDMRQLNPGASLVSGVAGGLALPMGAGLRAGGMLRGIAQAGALGGAEGFVMGLGEAEGTAMERLKAPDPWLGLGVGAATAGALGLPAALAGRSARQVTQGPVGRRVAKAAGRAGGEMQPTGPLRLLTGGRYEDIPRPDVRMADLASRRAEIGRQVYSPFESMTPSPRVRSEAANLQYHAQYGPEIREAMGDLDTDSFEGLQKAYSALKEIADAPATTTADRTARAHARALAKEFGDEMEAAFPGFQVANTDFRKASQVVEAFEIGYLGSRRSGRTRLDAAESVTNLLQPARLRLALDEFGGNPEAQSALKEGLRGRMVDDFLSTGRGLSPTARKLLDMDPKRAREVVQSVFDTPESAAQFQSAIEQAARDADGTLGQLLSSLGRSLFIRSVPARPRGG